MNKELVLLDLIASDSSKSQREIARLMDVSLGTVNNMIGDLEDNKLLSVKKISSRKVYYQLTKKGKEYHNSLYVCHISNCFDTIAFVRKNFRDNLYQLVEAGKTEFYIDGHTDELVRLAKMCFMEISRKKKVNYQFIKDMDDFDEKIAAIEGDEGRNHIVVGWATHSKVNNQSLTYKNLLS